MNNQRREETSEIRKEENEIWPSYAGNDKIQSDDQSQAVQSYPSLAADASAQGDHISSTSPITRTRSKSAVSHYKDAAADDVNEEQVIDAENPAFPQTVVDITSMHEQHGTTNTSQDVKDFQNSALFWIMQQKALLCKAALKGDWKAAEAILRVEEGFASLCITQSDDKLLHIAAGAKQTKFVRELVEFMTEDDLALTNEDRNTAFFIAAASGVVEIAKVMYERNHELPTVRGGNGMTPLYMAALLGKKDMVSYLHKVTRLDNLETHEHMLHFEAAINIEMFGKILNRL